MESTALLFGAAVLDPTINYAKRIVTGLYIEHMERAVGRVHTPHEACCWQCTYCTWSMLLAV